jgi:hypothetical protein
MNTSQLLGALCACLIACFSASTNTTEDGVPVAENSNHDVAVDNIGPEDDQGRDSNASGVQDTVFVISAGMIGFFLLRKVNKG